MNAQTLPQSEAQPKEEWCRVPGRWGRTRRSQLDRSMQLDRLKGKIETELELD